MKNIIITGGSGLVGRHLDKLLTQLGYQVRILTTQRQITDQKKYFFWEPVSRSMDEAVWKDAHAIVHLAGANIGAKRWTEKRRKEIISSRVDSAKFLYDQVQKFRPELEVFVSASAVGYYGAVTVDQVFKEGDQPYHDFLSEVCSEWEKAAEHFRKSHARTVILRTGVVLAKDSPAFRKMLMPVKLGIGSPLGSGYQYMPWIHIHDLCNIYLKALADENMKGVFNAVSPQHVDNRTFMYTLSKKMHRPFFMPRIPEFVLNLLFGEMADIIIEGSRVEPAHLNQIKFKFHFDNLSSAMDDILH